MNMKKIVAMLLTAILLTIATTTAFACEDPMRHTTNGVLFSAALEAQTIIDSDVEWMTLGQFGAAFSNVEFSIQTINDGLDNEWLSLSMRPAYDDGFKITFRIMDEKFRVSENGYLLLDAKWFAARIIMHAQETIVGTMDE